MHVRNLMLVAVAVAVVAGVIAFAGASRKPDADAHAVSLELASDELHAATPPGWFVGRRGQRQGLRHRQLITMAVIAAAVISGCFGMNRGHPEPNRVRGYGIELSLAGGPFEIVMIGANGEGATSCSRITTPIGHVLLRRTSIRAC